MGSSMITTRTRNAFPLEPEFIPVSNRAGVIESLEQLRIDGSSKIALVTITLTYKSKTRQYNARQGRRIEQTNLYLLENIRPLVRKTDRVLLCEKTMYFLLREADSQGAEIVEERLWEALLWRVHNMGSKEYIRPTTISIGHAAYSEACSHAYQAVAASEVPQRTFSQKVGSLSRPYETDAVTAATETEIQDLPLLAKKLGIPYLALLPRKLPRRVLHVLSAGLARELHCYPLGRERDMLTVAMLDPQNPHTLERLHQETGLHIFPVLTHPEALEDALEQLY